MEKVIGAREKVSPSPVGVGSGAPEIFLILSFEMSNFYAFWTMEEDSNYVTS